MKVGDLVKVRYAIKNPYDSSIEDYGGDFIGIVTETPECHKWAIYQMWCLTTQTIHTLMPDRDLIEVISEGR